MLKPNLQCDGILSCGSLGDDLVMRAEPSLGISDLMKENTESSFVPSAMWQTHAMRTQQKKAI